MKNLLVLCLLSMAACAAEVEATQIDHIEQTLYDPDHPGCLKWAGPRPFVHGGTPIDSLSTLAVKIACSGQETARAGEYSTSGGKNGAAWATPRNGSLPVYWASTQQWHADPGNGVCFKGGVLDNTLLDVYSCVGSHCYAAANNSDGKTTPPGFGYHTKVRFATKCHFKPTGTLMPDYETWIEWPNSDSYRTNLWSGGEDGQGWDGLCKM